MRAVDAYRRIPEELKAHSFYGRYDLWKYEGIYDNVICTECLNNAVTDYFIGTELRGKFKYHRVIDANTIEVWVHPHCRCLLHRETTSWKYLVEITPFLKE